MPTEADVTDAQPPALPELTPVPASRPLGSQMAFPTMLYEVRFADGTVYAQNSLDRSLTDPSRSCYFDWKHRKAEVVHFELLGQGTHLVLDLVTGVFTLNGIAFTGSVHWQALEGVQRHLIWSVQTRPQRVSRVNVAAQTAETLSESYRRRYLVGWEAILPDGRPVECVIGIEEA